MDQGRGREVHVDLEGYLLLLAGVDLRKEKERHSKEDSGRRAVIRKMG